jgi:hypothetical protein
MQLIYKGPESFGQDQVSQILVVQQDLVLVVEQFPRAAAVVAECELMGIYCACGVERPAAEVHVLVARTAQDHYKEVDLETAAVLAFHPVFAKVNLAILAEWQFWKLLALARFLGWLGNGVLLTDVHHIIVDGFAAHFLQHISIVFLQVVLYLLAGETRTDPELVQDE